MSINPTNPLDEILKIYLANLLDEKREATLQDELEIRFGNKNKKVMIQRQDYDNIIRHLYASGFKPCDNNLQGIQYLRMSIENNIRLELIGKEIIQEYCRNNNLRTCLENPAHSTTVPHKGFPVKAKITSKTQVMGIKDIINDDFHFKISYKLEKDTLIYHANQPNIEPSIEEWKDKVKYFRFIKRIRFYHDTIPIFVDISVVKSATGLSMTEAGLLRREPTYEIELELDSKKSKNMPHAILAKHVRHMIRIVLCAWQNTMYPIPVKEQEIVLREYQDLLEWDHYQHHKKRPGDLKFMGPKSITLQKHHLADLQKDSYTVTDKADGERHLLFVSSKGRIYLINSSLQIIFTGCSVHSPGKMKNILIDGEYISSASASSTALKESHFAAFDIYFGPPIGDNQKVLATTLYNKPFTQGPFTQGQGEGYRLSLLEYWMDKLNQEIDEQSKNNLCRMLFHVKTFYGVGPMNSSCRYYIPCNHLYEGAVEIWEKKEKFFYELDGLIYTPARTDITGTFLKWKPRKFNTIDFLVSIEQDGKKDKIQTFAGNDSKYKTLILRCGFKTDIFPHSYQNMLRNEIPQFTEELLDGNSGNNRSNNNYKPVRFIPSDPHIDEAYICHIEMSKEEKIYTTEPREIIENHTIVEFEYDATIINPKMRWKPLRIRHDKTAQLRMHQNNFGNDFRVADSNWYSIHHPITEDMILKPTLETVDISDQQVYYKNNGDHFQYTMRLRNFHNYLKTWLIQSTVKMCKKASASASAAASAAPIHLLDVSVGKAGDLGKWILAGVSFVWGIDYAKDNIINNVDGACSRYIQNRIQNPQNPFRAVFLHGNSALNYRDGSAFEGEDSQAIAATILFNTDTQKNDKQVNTQIKYITDQKYHLVRDKMGIGRDGFHICSCQFSLHYFFGNAESFHGFLRNISENTLTGGYFMGTCYDGESVFQLFQKQADNIIQFSGNPEKKDMFFRLEKKYDQETFVPNSSCLGYKIGVYQEHINQDLDEYLVHFGYLEEMLKLYGFHLAESKLLDGKSSSAKFDELYRDLPRNNYKPMNMSPQEQTISFLNRYFIFQKSDVPVNAEVVANNQIAAAAMTRLTPVGVVGEKREKERKKEGKEDKAEKKDKGEKKERKKEGKEGKEDKGEKKSKGEKKEKEGKEDKGEKSKGEKKDKVIKVKTKVVVTTDKPLYTSDSVEEGEVVEEKKDN